MRFALISFFILAVVGLAAGFVSWYFTVERPRRQRKTIERALCEQRGSQTAEEFALLFENESVGRIAKALYPHLQLLTVTGAVPLRPSDLLFQELRVDDEDLVDAIDDALIKLGRSRPNRQEWKLAGCDKISTVDELVKASCRLLNPLHDMDRASDCR
jgi:hypothetical protein